MDIFLSLYKELLNDIYSKFNIMKTILLCMMLMLSGMLTAQTVDNPPFKARSGSIGNITRIERTPDARVFIFTPSSVRTGG